MERWHATVLRLRLWESWMGVMGKSPRRYKLNLIETVRGFWLRERIRRLRLATVESKIAIVRCPKHPGVNIARSPCVMCEMGV
jgi:hypothetical protein